MHHKIIGFYCKKCEIIFPIKDGIFILLAKEARNFNLEYPLLKIIEKEISKKPSSDLEKFVEKTLILLSSKKDLLTWEWEDEKYWSREYAKEFNSGIKKNWNDRIWEREVLVKELMNRLSLENKNILSIGCGEGQNFRFLFKKFCNENSLYIATDISFDALKLNRFRNTHKNSLYILCSADHELPFSDNMIDVICYFGILHHTENKSANIIKDKRLIHKNGYIILAEAVDRPILRLKFLQKWKSEESAHEGHINKDNLFSQLTKNNIEVFFVLEKGSPFFTGMMTYFRKYMLYNKQLFLFILKIDSFIIKILGLIIPSFKACEILILASCTIK